MFFSRVKHGRTSLLGFWQAWLALALGLATTAIICRQLHSDLAAKAPTQPRLPAAPPSYAGRDAGRTIRRASKRYTQNGTAVLCLKARRRFPVVFSDGGEHPPAQCHGGRASSPPRQRFWKSAAQGGGPTRHPLPAWAAQPASWINTSAASRCSWWRNSGRLIRRARPPGTSRSSCCAGC